MMDYKKAGVDIEAGYKSVELMKEYVKGTMRPEVLGGLGGFFRSIFHVRVQRDGGAYSAVRYGRRGNQAETGIPDG